MEPSDGMRGFLGVGGGVQLWGGVPFLGTCAQVMSKK